MYEDLEGYVFGDLRPGLKSFWTHCENLLQQGIKPTPKLLTDKMDRSHRSLSGDECKIRVLLMERYGYKLNTETGRYVLI